MLWSVDMADEKFGQGVRAAISPLPFDAGLAAPVALVVPAGRTGRTGRTVALARVGPNRLKRRGGPVAIANHASFATVALVALVEGCRPRPCSAHTLVGGGCRSTSRT